MEIEQLCWKSATGGRVWVSKDTQSKLLAESERAWGKVSEGESHEKESYPRGEVMNVIIIQGRINRYREEKHVVG